MTAIREWFWRVIALARRRHITRDFADELQTHQQLLIDDFRASGMTDAEARRAAGAKLGSLPAAMTAYQNQAGVPAVEHCVGDLRYAIRSLRQTPAAAFSMVFVLGLGIGLSTVVATVLHALVWQPLPVPEADRVVKVGVLLSGRFSRHVQGGEWLVSLPELETFRQSVHALEGVAGVDDENLTWQHDGQARTVRAALVTQDYFPVLEVRAARGQLLGAADANAPVAVISHQFWTNELAGDPAVIGRSLVLGRTPYTIVGVTPETFSGTEIEPTDVWAPLAFATRALGDATALTESDFSWLQLFGRLRPGATLASATGEANGVATGLDREHPGRHMAVFITRASRFESLSFRSHDRGLLIAGGTTTVLVIVVVLLICGSNVAALLLSRGASREKEFAVRIALGAGRRRLVQLLVTELAVIAAGSTLAALGIATGVLDALQRWLPVREIIGTLTPDLRMLSFAAAYAAIVIIAFGLAPVRHALRLDCLGTLKGSPGKMPAMQFRRLIIATQVAVSLALLIGSSWGGRALARAVHIDLGYSPEGLFIVQPDRASVPGGTAADLAQFVDRLRETVTSTPGVSAVGTTVVAPFWGSSTTSVQVEGAAELVQTRFSVADDQYFRALGVVPSAGRIPRTTETDVIVVNAAFARRFWGTDTQALGHVVSLQPSGHATRRPMRIVGVIPAIDTINVGQTDAPTYYLPVIDRTSTLQNLVVRAAKGTPIARVVTDAARTLAPGAFVRIVPVNDRLRGQLTPSILGAALAAMVGLLSLIVAGVGIHGLVSHAVTAGTHDIGIRLALGAPPDRILTSVVGTNLHAAAIGAAVCLLVLFAVSRWASGPFRAVFLGLDPADPVPYVTAALVLGVAVCAATYVPARRALGVDPIVSLRRE
jgi:predicted permease